MDNELRKFESKRLGRNLRAFREARGLTQEEVAKYLGIDSSTYCGYEIGRRSLPVHLVSPLCRFLNIQPNDLWRTL